MKKIIPFCLLLSAGKAFAQNTGIGTPNPLMGLHIQKGDSAALLLNNSTNTGSLIKTAMFFKTGNAYSGSIAAIGSGFTHRMGFFTFGGDAPSDLIERMTILDNGNIGISNTSPAARLDVTGTFRATGLATFVTNLQIQGGTPAANKVLTATDALGNTTWATSAGGLTLPFSGSDASAGTTFLIANTNGAANGISGQSFGTGNGVQGLTSGGKGIYGSANAGTGVDAYSNTGTAGVFTSNTGLAIKTVSGNVEINGKIKIADGTQGVGKVLTSDGAGTASWAAPSGNPAFASRKTTGNQTITTGVSSYTKIIFPASATTPGPGFSPATSDFTAPTAGFYHFDVTLSLSGNNAIGSAISYAYIALFKRTSAADLTGAAYYNYEFNYVYPLNSKGFSATLYLEANEIIDVRMFNQSGVNIIVESNPVTNYSFFGGYKVY